MRRTVLFVTLHDWANSGWRYCEAVNQFSATWQCEYFAVYEHPFQYPRRTVQNGGEAVLEELKRAAQKADLIHVKENSGVISRIADVEIPVNRKPVVITFGGSTFPKYANKVLEKTQEIVDVYTATMPSNCVREDFVLLPFAYPQLEVKTAKSAEVIVIGHDPSNPKRKGTEEIVRAAQEAVRETRVPAVLNISVSEPWYLVQERKRLNHIYIDQLNDHGCYGNSAVEAMRQGSVTLAPSEYGASGVINVRSKEDVKEALIRLLTDWQERGRWAAKAELFFEETHSYPVVAKKIEAVYAEAVRRFEAARKGALAEV